MTKPRVLFLCTGNSCRSQMAEGLLRFLGHGDLEAFSAGTDPKGLHPLAVKVMAEVQIDISQQKSKHVDAFGGESFDVVITVCDHANEQCPVWPGAPRRLHWSLEDPASASGSEGQRLVVFRRVRDEIRERLRLFLVSNKLAP